MNFIKKHKKITIILGSILLIVLMFFIFRSNSPKGEDSPTFTVVHTIQKGSVSSGIETTGTIIAAQKLDLGVYKQTQRIELVSVVNGGRVNAGEIILSFDKSRAKLNVQSSEVQLNRARLGLQEIQENINDPDIGIQSLGQQVEDLKISILQKKEAKIDAYTDFLNKDLALEPVNKNDFAESIPLVTGYYNYNKAGEYRIKTYGSAAKSGYSFRYDGLSSGAETIFFDTALEIDNSGIELTFSSNIKRNTDWILALPNTYASSYSKNKEDYEELIIELDKQIASLESDLENALQSLDDETFSDGQDFRSLVLLQAQSELSQAQVELLENRDVVQDQNIVAPFSGTIEGLENVVVGATPTRDTNDPISFGTLISDDFLVKFSLSAVDVTKVSIGQKVIVDITSFKNITPLEALITEISSLPQSDSIAQYEVQALISIDSLTDMSLREGLLADIQIVQEEVSDVLRVPKSSIRYEKGKAFIDVIADLNEEQQESIADRGIIRSETGDFPSYPTEIEVGIIGTFYTEVSSGTEEGIQIIVTQNDPETNVVQQSDFRGRPSERSEGGRGQ